MTFDAARYLDTLSMNGGRSELTTEQNAQVWAELHRRMGETPQVLEPTQTEVANGTPAA
jgi:hypothetical protein